MIVDDYAEKGGASHSVKSKRHMCEEEEEEEKEEEKEEEEKEEEKEAEDKRVDGTFSQLFLLMASLKRAKT
ncbi:unnamed protein product [Schistocephalus solidus]|uniref:Uncharacterized protein n=1 Tax=Schistocephalus solidus TaxID=70667 RepID=A0A183SG07_SCHSO|nr:unnamed protein product [Schistocephalus solidus]